MSSSTPYLYIDPVHQGGPEVHLDACPACQAEVETETFELPDGNDPSGETYHQHAVCPSCENILILLDDVWTKV